MNYLLTPFSANALNNPEVKSPSYSVGMSPTLVGEGFLISLAISFLEESNTLTCYAQHAF